MPYIAQRFVEKQRLFKRVMGGRVDLGFYILAQKSWIASGQKQSLP
jgi:hypothetical protein